MNIKNKIKQKEYNAQHRVKNLNIQTEKIDYYSLFLKSKKCYYCGKKLVYPDIEFDHYIPLSLGGSHTEQNIRLSCTFCNRHKASYNPYIFFLYEKHRHQYLMYDLLKEYMETKSLYCLQQVQPFIKFSAAFNKRMKNIKHVKQIMRNFHFKPLEKQLYKEASEYIVLSENKINLEKIYNMTKRCFYCDTKISVINLHFDTLVPFVYGGKLTEKNIITSCIRCNTLRYQLFSHDINDDLNVIEFYKNLIVYGAEFQRIKSINYLSSINREYIQTLNSRLPKPSSRFKSFCLQFKKNYFDYCYNKNLFKIDIHKIEDHEFKKHAILDYLP